jgi:hypothetical protein
MENPMESAETVSPPPPNASPNTMRQTYRALTGYEVTTMATLKDFGQDFYDFVEHMGQSRELSLAKTKIEEAVMWAVKHVTR